MDCIKGSPFNFATESMLKKPKGLPLLHFSATHFEILNFGFSSKFFKCLHMVASSNIRAQRVPLFTILKKLRFLSVRYSADVPGLFFESSSLFFSPPFNGNFEVLKNCPYYFHKILHSHSTPKGAIACAMASKSYDWDVRNIVKISPKMAKKLPVLDFFDFLKYSLRFERTFVESFYTI